MIPKAEPARTFTFASQIRIQNEHTLGSGKIKLPITGSGIQETGYVC